MKQSRKQMIWTIIDAVQHGRYPEKQLEGDDAMLTYYNLTAKNEIEILEDEFDYVEHANPYYVWFLVGTGHENFSIPLSWLTYDSLKKLYDIYK
jgi:hypothetical protein